jgi:stress response protein YsnF
MRETVRPPVENGELDTTVIPVVEEKASVVKRPVTSGRVVVKTTVDTEERTLRETLSEEKVDVERVAINRIVDVVPHVRTEGDVTIIPVLEERLVVEKQLVLVEEVRIRRSASAETVEVPVTLRKERATVERPNGDGEPITDLLEERR